MFTKSILPAAALLLATPLTSVAQFIADPVQATAGRDSLFDRVNGLRKQIEAESQTLATKTPWNGLRRVVVYGYYKSHPQTKPPVAWKHKTVLRRGDVKRELFKAYMRQGQVAFKERRHNGVLTWLLLREYRPLYTSLVLAPNLGGSYTAPGYVRWRGKNYLLPARLLPTL